jgi:hypothetical protein
LLDLRTRQIRAFILGKEIQQIDLIVRLAPKVYDSKPSTFPDAWADPANLANSGATLDQRPASG